MTGATVFYAHESAGIMASAVDASTLRAVIGNYAAERLATRRMLGCLLNQQTGVLERVRQNAIKLSSDPKTHDDERELLVEAIQVMAVNE